MGLEELLRSNSEDEEFNDLVIWREGLVNLFSLFFSVLELLI